MWPLLAPRQQVRHTSKPSWSPVALWGVPCGMGRMLLLVTSTLWGLEVLEL